MIRFVSVFPYTLLLLLASCSGPPQKDTPPSQTGGSVTTELPSPNSSIAYANPWSNLWPKLKVFNFLGVTLAVDPSLILSVNANSPLANSGPFARIKLSEASDEFEVTSFQESKHPSLSIMLGDGREISGNIYICIPNDGRVYTSEYRGHHDDYSISKTYVVSGNSVSELKQPFYKTTLSTGAGTKIELRSSEDEGSFVVGDIPKGETVQVIGVSTSDDHTFLVQNQLGVVGWHKVFQVSEEKTEGDLPKSMFSLNYFNGVYP